MAGLQKRVLNGLFEEALHDSGWRALMLPPTDVFPARFQLTQGTESFTVSLYIWTISHGGGAARAAKEYRIQITDGGKSLTQFVPEQDGKTLIIGWWPEAQVFAGFDYAHHTGPLGKSPSIQVGEDALRKAATDGMAVHTRGNGEIVIAFRPEFMGTYVAQMEDLHKIGISEQEVALLGRIVSEPASVTDKEIGAQADPSHQRTMVNVRRAARAYRFSARVLVAYGHRCAFCGVQLRLLDAAHILPVAHPGSVDKTENGVAVCALHHRAYDNGLITFDHKSKIHVNEEAVAELKAQGLDGGLKQFTDGLRKQIVVPAKPADQPKAAIIRQANKHRGWKKL